VRVIDGDTIDVGFDGVIERVRLILIDTPEVSGGVECYGREASARTAALLPVGSTVTLERDVSERDRFDRLLRYMYIADGRMLNEVLVADGFATVATFPPDVKHLDRLREAEAAARAGSRGLWSACAETPTPTATPQPAATTDPRAGCDASYPTVCIPRFPPDLDCGDIPFRRFRVVGSDPHGFDRDRDGIGCES
jgi:micrococcal nuclease